MLGFSGTTRCLLIAAVSVVLCACVSVAMYYRSFCIGEHHLESMLERQRQHEIARVVISGQGIEMVLSDEAEVTAFSEAILSARPVSEGISGTRYNITIVFQDGARGFAHIYLQKSSSNYALTIMPNGPSKWWLAAHWDDYSVGTDYASHLYRLLEQAGKASG